MEKLFGALLYLLIPAFFILTLFAYYEGMETWLGWGFWASFGIMVVALAIRDIGGLFLAGVAFVGMWKGWEWPFLISFVLAFPMIAFLVVTMLSGGIMQVFARRSGRYRI